MEKEKKGLFGRLLDFWREIIGTGGTDSIGFWNDTENVEKHFAELGAVASLSQRETKKAFWEETAESVMEKKAKEKEILFAEKAEEKKTQDDEEATVEKQKPSVIFTADIFREEGSEKAEESVMGRSFLWEEPVEEKEGRKIVPVAAEVKKGKAEPVEREQELPKREVIKKEEKQAESAVDIEKLMREMTKKLWEERESCGRRLR